MKQTFFWSLLVLVANLSFAKRIINFETIGAKPHDKSYETALANGNLFNATLNSLQPGDVFFFSNKTFTITGGIKARDLKGVTLHIDGTISFVNDRESWPKNANGGVEECIYLENIEDFTLTSSGKGTIDGNGQEWWGAIEFLKHQEDRPRLFHIVTSKNVLVENMLFKDSPYWTFYAENSDGLLIRYSDVSARWTKKDTHTLIDLQAFNTDGFDVTGKNVYIHDCNIWNQDDCIAVKDGSENMLFERIVCSGLGLVIGSIGSSRVHNITFRDSYLPNTVKGIYLKTRWSDSGPVGEQASITDVFYENITIDNPIQYGIWIGPAQQTGQPCSLLWTKTKNAECHMSGYQIWDNIVLKDITINNPSRSPGVLMGNTTFPMKNIVFDNVVVNNPGDQPWGDAFYYCEGIEGTALGNTYPVPPCFKTGSSKGSKSLRGGK
jgi:polygalacturonase